MTQRIILYAEDEKNDVFFLELAFEAVGIRYPIKAVTDGQAAIDYLSGAGHFVNRSLFPLPCLILLDINMPKKSGFEVLEWIRQRPGIKSLPVLVLTSSSNALDMEKASQLGADAYLIKPSNPLELRGVAESIRSRWLPKAKPEKKVKSLPSKTRQKPRPPAPP
jgi:CheY-like chemotaxis protein